MSPVKVLTVSVTVRPPSVKVFCHRFPESPYSVMPPAPEMSPVICDRLWLVMTCEPASNWMLGRRVVPEASHSSGLAVDPVVEESRRVPSARLLSSLPLTVESPGATNPLICDNPPNFNVPPATW